MLSKNLKLIFFSLIFLAFILSPGLALAQKLEIQYPPIPFGAAETPDQFLQKIETGAYPPEYALPLYIKYFYYLALTIAGLVALGAIIFGGFQYLISFGAPVKMITAKEQISGGFLSLIILFSSYLILVLINPQLVVFKVPGIEKPPLSETEIPKIDFGSSTYFQIPTGIIIENAVLNQVAEQKMNGAKTAAEEARKASQELKDLTKELKEETNKCRCGITQCKGLPTCEVDGCPYAKCNIAEIKRISKEIEEAIEILEEKREKAKTATFPLVKDLSQLEAAALLMSLEYEKVFTYNDLLSIRQYPYPLGREIEIRSFPGWENIDLQVNGRIIKDPLTFYLDEKGSETTIYFASVYYWGEGAGLPPEPPGGWMLPPPPEPGKIAWPLPLENLICTNDFGACRPLGQCTRIHIGLDFGAAFDTPVYVVADGKVTYKGYMGGYGNLIIVEHSELGLSTRYAHLSKFYVRKGDEVRAGQLIAGVDNTGTSTGNHLHFEVRNKDGLPLDPKNYLPSSPSIAEDCYSATTNYYPGYPK